MVNTPNLDELARSLELRWRMRRFGVFLAGALIASTAISLTAGLVHVISSVTLPMGRIILLVNGAAVVVSLVLAAIRHRPAQLLLADADQTYDTRELLSSAVEFAGDGRPRTSETEVAFRELVAAQGDEFAATVEPAIVYPLSVPRHGSVAVALAVALGVLLLLNASGWFRGPSVELSQEGLLLEDAARRLTEQSPNEALSELADEIRRLGEQLRNGGMDPEEARRRIDQLGERVEEQMRNLERLGEFDTNQDVDLPPETEETVRSALRSGMTDGEVMDFFARMKADGQTLPDTLRALDEATTDRDLISDTDLGLDDERIRELLDQLNLNPEGLPDAELTEQLENAQRSLKQAGAGLQSLTEGLDSEFGDPVDPGESAPGGSAGQDEPEEMPPGDLSSNDNAQSGELAGELAVKDAMDDAFTRIEDANPVFRQIEGIVGEGTIRDILVRELPSQAISRLPENEREAAFERVIEEAIGRSNTPPELQHLVRNYFLRITLGSDQGERNEQ